MANTVTFKCADGKSMAFPLDYLLEGQALLVSQVNGEPIENSIGSGNQLWIKQSTGKYFLKDIVEVAFSKEKKPPKLEAIASTDNQHTNRPNVAIKGVYHQCTLGESLTLEGYASDYDRRVVAVEFSLDEGQTWTVQPTTGATADRWVYWSVAYTPKESGLYHLLVRAENDRGEKSQIPASCDFEVLCNQT